MNKLIKVLLPLAVAGTTVAGASTASAADSDYFAVSNARGGRTSGTVLWTGPQSARLRGTVATDLDGQPAAAWVRFCQSTTSCGGWNKLAETNSSFSYDRSFYSSNGSRFVYADIVVVEQYSQSPIDRNLNGGD